MSAFTKGQATNHSSAMSTISSSSSPSISPPISPPMLPGLISPSSSSSSLQSSSSSSPRSRYRNRQRVRKQRVVKNGYIEVDNVKALPGYSYCEWIRISKEKLIERETALMQIRINQIKSIANKAIESNQQYEITANLLRACDYQMAHTIDSWTGIDLNKKISSRPYNTFREYFNVAKNWWDQKKTNILGQFLWSPCLVDIQQFVENKQALYRILSGLFNANVKYANTKQQPLIPNGVIKNCKEMKKFLYSLDKELNIDQWLRNEIIKVKQYDAKQNQIRKRTGNAKIIADRLRSMLAKLANGDNINVNNDNVMPKMERVDESEWQCNDNRQLQSRQHNQVHQLQKQLTSDVDTKNIISGTASIVKITDIRHDNIPSLSSPSMPVQHNNNHIQPQSTYKSMIMELADKFIANTRNNQNSIRCNNYVHHHQQQQININHQNNTLNVAPNNVAIILVPVSNFNPMGYAQSRPSIQNQPQIPIQSMSYTGCHNMGNYRTSAQRFNPLSGNMNIPNWNP